MTWFGSYDRTGGLHVRVIHGLMIAILGEAVVAMIDHYGLMDRVRGKLTRPSWAKAVCV